MRYPPSARLQLAQRQPDAQPTVAIPTNRGTFHDLAIGHWFPQASRLHLPTPSAMAEVVDEGLADWAVLAVLNHVIGRLPQHWELLSRHRLEVHDSVWLPIQQALLVRPGTALESIRQVVSHPAALAQCSDIIREHQWAPLPQADTADAAAQVAHAQDSTLAAIGPAHLAAELGLDVLRPDISNLPDNQTQFLLLASSRHRAALGGSL